MGLSGKAWQCLAATLWLYGKRISEVVCLKTKDIFTTKRFLGIRFEVLKKESRSDEGIRKPFTKRITLDNPYTKYIIDYWENIKDLEEFMFPRKQTKTGHIYREYFWRVLKKVSPDLSSHLFRHSLATTMAEEDATAYEMVTWFDWDRTDTALDYIKRSGRLTRRLSRRKW